MDVYARLLSRSLARPSNCFVARSFDRSVACSIAQSLGRSFDRSLRKRFCEVLWPKSFAQRILREALSANHFAHGALCEDLRGRALRKALYAKYFGRALRAKYSVQSTWHQGLSVNTLRKVLCADMLALNHVTVS